MKSNKHKIINLLLRALTVGLRFLFVFFIGKYVSLSLVGQYSLWTTTIALSVMVLGMDFYTYSTREILKKTKLEQWSLVRDHGVFLGVSYLVILPLMLLIFQFDVLDPALILWFYLVLVLEHLGTEIYRLFNTLERPLLANFLLFIRSAVWILLLVWAWYHDDFAVASISQILQYWSLGALISLVLGLYFLLQHYKGTALRKVDWAYLKTGLRAAIWLLLGTLSFKVIELSDRYMIEHYLGDEQLGVFSIFYQVTNLINVVVFTVVLTIYYPSLMKSVMEKSVVHKGVGSKMMRQSLAIIFGLGILIVLMMPLLIEYMQRPQLMDEFVILYPMLGAVLALNVYLIYRFYLNAWNMDKTLLWIILLAALVNLAINFYGIPKYGIITASISSLVSYTILAGLTFFTARKTMSQTSFV